MSDKHTAFYRGNTQVLVDFSAGAISSDGALVLLEHIERKQGLIGHFASVFPDHRMPGKVSHGVEKLLRQRIFMMMQGYQDCNDVEQLIGDPLFEDVLGGIMASQPTLSRFENSMDKHAMFDLSRAWVDRYVDSLAGRGNVTIDIDATDDPAHGTQQLCMFNGFYGQFMYNELLFHDGQTGQIILPVLRPGNSHSNRWYIAILRRVVERIRRRYPDLQITIRADSGFSCPDLHTLAEEYDLYFVVGIASNAVLKQKVATLSGIIGYLFVDHGTKFQHYSSYDYQAGSWPAPQRCYSKIESTGKGLNVRHVISNIPDKTPRQIYQDIYVQRGEASENRIKELKNMCFSDRLSNHRFWANFLRLFLSALVYECFLLLKQAIAKTTDTQAKKWQISTIRTKLLKVGATIHKTKRRIYYRLSSAFVYQNLFRKLLAT